MPARISSEADIIYASNGIIESRYPFVKEIDHNPVVNIINDNTA
ncbi:MAG: hypothetical protein AAFN93_03540 [Bacteroidota bacterium]